jgi:hypothetical protein
MKNMILEIEDLNIEAKVKDGFELDQIVLPQEIIRF